MHDMDYIDLTTDNLLLITVLKSLIAFIYLKNFGTFYILKCEVCKHF